MIFTSATTPQSTLLNQGLKCCSLKIRPEPISAFPMLRPSFGSQYFITAEFGCFYWILCKHDIDFWFRH